MTAKILMALEDWYTPALGYYFPLKNAYPFKRWETDFYCNKQGVDYEFEVKISRSDFMADFKKKDKHKAMIEPKGLCPHRFFYVCPKELIGKEEVPQYAGLIYYSDEYGLSKLRVVKRAPRIHSRLQGRTIKAGLCEKFFHYWNEEKRKAMHWKRKYDELLIKTGDRFTNH